MVNENEAVQTYKYFGIPGSGKVRLVYMYVSVNLIWVVPINPVSW